MNTRLLAAAVITLVATTACDPFSLMPGLFSQPTPTAQLPTATPDPVAADCSQLNLTPEECANMGTHQYYVAIQSINRAPSTYYGCDIQPETYSGATTIAFRPDHTLEPGAMGESWVYSAGKPFPKIGTNVYEITTTQTDKRGQHTVHTDTITFAADGFIHDMSIKDIDYSLFHIDCTHRSTFTFLDASQPTAQAAPGEPELTEAARPKPQAPTADFGFRFESAPCFTDVLDTFQGTFTKDLMAGRLVTIPLRLSSEQMKAVYAKMMEINFFDYPGVFAIPTPASGLMTIQTPAERYHILVKSGGTTKTLDWKDEIVAPKSREADNLRALFEMIESMISASPEYKQLPERNGGCA